MLGRTGIHADPDLDIGGNAERLLEEAGCAVLLSTREHHPETDPLAAVSTSWTRDAEVTARLLRVRDLALRGSLRLKAEKKARAAGATEVTLAVAEARAAMAAQSEAATPDGANVCPFAKPAQAATPGPIADPAQPEVDWTEEARAMLGGVPLGFCRDISISAAESIARNKGVSRIDAD